VKRVFSTGTISPTGNYGRNLAVNVLIPFQLGRSTVFVGNFCSIHLVGHSPPGCRSFAMHFPFNSVNCQVMMLESALFVLTMPHMINSFD
jgi:hypothetical protein